MSSLDYQPSPLDVSPVSLSPSILELAEHLAKNTHDLWAKARFEEGWKHGPLRDDLKKEHPNLVPYDQLSESEREYDRRTVLGTLRVILALGYEIHDPACSIHYASPGQIDKVKEIIRNLPSEQLSLRELRAIWKNRDVSVWSFYPEIFIFLAERLIGLGEPILGHDVIMEGLRFFKSNPSLKKMQALSLAQTGATHAAQSILQEMLQDGIQDPDVLGILARTHKDLWQRAHDPVQRQGELRLAHGRYLEGFQKTGDIYNGINAASLSLFLGNQKEAETLAKEIQQRCLVDLRENGETYWGVATLAESLLILGDLEGAQKQYALAASLAGRNLSGISASQRQARLILSHFHKDPGLLDDAFGMFSVAVFVGHMVDIPNRLHPRFTAEMVERVKNDIHALLDERNVRIGYASVASGSDILFLESVLERGGEIHVVLPFDMESFKKISVQVGENHDWDKRFDQVIGKAATVTCASPHEHLGSEATFEFGNQLLLGLATLKGRTFGAPVMPMAVWDGLPGDGPGGTASCIDIWRGLGRKVEVIPLRQAPMDSRGTAQTELSPRPHPEVFTKKIKAMLFADVIGYSKLTEREIPIYIERFMGSIAALLQQTSFKPEVKNTWGDALYLTFHSIHSAGHFALQLQSLVQQTEWRKWGLTSELHVRIGLHAGPVIEAFDPVAEMKTFTGYHVSRAARIEPIVQEDQIYVSESFAALAAANNISDFVCEYIGEKFLAKGDGTSRVYLLRKEV